MMLHKFFKAQFILGALSMMLSTVFVFFLPTLAGQLFGLGLGNLLFGALFSAFYDR
jgi:hypothetical protein